MNQIRFIQIILLQFMLQVYLHPNSLIHEMGEQHLEAPVRVKLIEEALKNASFDTKFIEARSAKESEILTIHSPLLLEAMKESESMPRMYLTPDTLTNKFTYSAAITAVGGAIQVAERIKDKSIQFAMLRPPGHHATVDVAMGFCFFNNIAISAKYLLEHKFKRVVILDVDNHHGNGTQEIFQRNPNVLYISMHADPRIAFPGTGWSDETGVGDGIGHSVNLPLPYQTQNEDYLAGFDEVVYPIIEQFKPEAILVSLGLDGLENDPYGSLSLTIPGYLEIGKRIGELSERLCKNRVGVILEGGYKYSEIGDATVSFFNGMIENKTESTIQPKLSTRFGHTLRTVKAIQRNHWFGI